jgi:hypothetical protein
MEQWRPKENFTHRTLRMAASNQQTQVWQRTVLSTSALARANLCFARKTVVGHDPDPFFDPVGLLSDRSNGSSWRALMFRVAAIGWVLFSALIAATAQGAGDPVQAPTPPAGLGVATPDGVIPKWTESAPADSKPGGAASTFAVVTRKGGIAAGLAHNHLIVAQGYSIKAESNPQSQLQPLSVRVAFDADSLLVDEPGLSAASSKRLVELGLTHAEFSEISDDDRKTVKEHMLAKDQLWAEMHPRIEAVASNFKLQETRLGNLTANYTADVTFQIRGQSVKKVMPLIVTQSDRGNGRGLITVEGLVSARFTEFGFKPYSGLLGAVRNQDEFHFYLRTQGIWIP